MKGKLLGPADKAVFRHNDGDFPDSRGCLAVDVHGMRNPQL